MQTIPTQTPRRALRRETLPPPAPRRWPQRPTLPYFLEEGDAPDCGHDFLLQNPRPDLTEAEAWTLAEDRLKLSLDLP